MKKGDKIIYNSGFGYEIGYFVGELENKAMDFDVEVDLRTGIVSNMWCNRNKIFPYTEELQKKLAERFGYDKKFP